MMIYEKYMLNIGYMHILTFLSRQWSLIAGKALIPAHPGDRIKHLCRRVQCHPALQANPAPQANLAVCFGFKQWW